MEGIEGKVWEMGRRACVEGVLAFGSVSVVTSM